jgi:integrase
MTRKRGNAEGSIYRDSDGRWRAAVNLGYRNGRRLRKKLSGRTRAEVAGKLATALRDHQLGLPVASERQTVGQYLEMWLEHVAKPNTRPKTYDAYEYMVRYRLKPALGDKVLSKLTPSDVRAFMQAMTEADLSAKTVKHLRDTLRCALNVAVRDGLIVRNSAALVKPPRPAPREMLVFTPDQARLFLDLARGKRLEALFTVAICLGLREAEALGLRWADIDLERAALTVRYQLQRVDSKLRLTEPKTEKSRRTIYMPNVTLSALAAHKIRQDTERQLAGSRWVETGMVFTTRIGTMLDQRDMLREFYRLLDTPDLRDPEPDAKKKRRLLPRLRFHDLRHSAATLLLVQGVPMKTVQEILGHSSFSTTANVYSHVLPAMKQEAAARMDAVFSPVAPNLAPERSHAGVKPS